MVTPIVIESGAGPPLAIFNLSYNSERIDHQLYNKLQPGWLFNIESLCSAGLFYK